MTRVYIPGIFGGIFFLVIGALCVKGAVDNYPAYRCLTDPSRTYDEHIACMGGSEVFQQDCFFAALCGTMGIMICICTCVIPPDRPTPDEDKLERLLMDEKKPVASVV